MSSDLITDTFTIKGQSVKEGKQNKKQKTKKDRKTFMLKL